MCKYAYVNTKFKRSSNEVKLLWLIDSSVKMTFGCKCQGCLNVRLKYPKISCSASFCTKCKYKYTFRVYKSDQLHKLLVQAAKDLFCHA